MVVPPHLALIVLADDELPSYAIIRDVLEKDRKQVEEATSTSPLKTYKVCRALPQSTGGSVPLVAALWSSDEPHMEEVGRLSSCASGNPEKKSNPHWSNNTLFKGILALDC